MLNDDFLWLFSSSLFIRAILKVGNVCVFTVIIVMHAGRQNIPVDIRLLTLYYFDCVILKIMYKVFNLSIYSEITCMT